MSPLSALSSRGKENLLDGVQQLIQHRHFQAASFLLWNSSPRRRWNAPIGFVSDTMAVTATTNIKEAQPHQVQRASPPVVSGKKVHYPFWFGGSASCFAAGVTHPLDLGRFEAIASGCSMEMVIMLMYPASSQGTFEAFHGRLDLLVNRC